MRLLNTKTFQLHEFFEPNIPDYVILSHRWGKNEVTFQQISKSGELIRRSEPQGDQHNGDSVESDTFENEGWAKLRNFCRQASQDGWLWVWMDTCCIDKTNSVELSEAVNSMFAWYKNSRICYVHLQDVPTPQSGPCARSKPQRESDVYLTGRSKKDQLEVAFEDSEWFRRGWTLQECLAPRYLSFYDNQWKYIGDKSDWADTMSRITGIPLSLFFGDDRFMTCPVAAKLSWASCRSCTRTEDMAYCLLGLLDIHMPLIYGEGSRAFIRLQQELIRSSDDNSILAWQFRPGKSALKLIRISLKHLI